MSQGSQALAIMEANGIHVDRAYLARATTDVDKRIRHLETRLLDSDIGTQWRKVYGGNTNLNSRDQLANVLYNVCKIDKPTNVQRLVYESRDQDEDDAKQDAATAGTGADEATLELINIPFTANYLKLQKLKKLRSTYLGGILREVEDDGRVHTSFSLSRVKTYRGACGDPNLQNVPIRNPEIGQIIRQAFIPSPGWRLIEIDYSAVEVRVAACYHKDPTMLQYIRDDYDMHRDMAIELFMVPPPDKDQKSAFKPIRNTAKNGFVFPEFYGDYYCGVSQYLWKQIKVHKLQTVDGVPLFDHLRSQGITSLGACDPKQSPVAGTFEKHVQVIEQAFWGERFKIYDQWRRDWYTAYCERGWFDTLTGFRIHGVFSRNFVINAPVQGSAFHLLLWSIIQIQRELRRRRMRTKLVLNIHDSLIADSPEDEYQDYMGMAKEIMTQGVLKHWPWIITPLAVEADVTPIDGSWHTKEEYKWN